MKNLSAPPTECYIAGGKRRPFFFFESRDKREISSPMNVNERAGNFDCLSERWEGHCCGFCCCLLLAGWHPVSQCSPSALTALLLLLG